MFRYRLNLPEQACHLRYGVPMAEALTIGMETNHMYLVSGNQILAVAVGMKVNRALQIGSCFE